VYDRNGIIEEWNELNNKEMQNFYNVFESVKLIKRRRVLHVWRRNEMLT